MLSIGGRGWRLIVAKNAQFCKVFKRVVQQRSGGGKTAKSQPRNKSKHYKRPEDHQVSQTVSTRGRHACCLSQIVRVSQSLLGKCIRFEMLQADHSFTLAMCRAGFRYRQHGPKHCLLWVFLAQSQYFNHQENK